MELLKIYCYEQGAITTASNTIQITASTAYLGDDEWESSNAQAFFQWRRQTQFTTSGTNMVEQPAVFDMTDGAGHGILIATDFIHLQVFSATTGNAVEARLKFLFRWKNVSIEEYIGIVQSQQWVGF